MAKYKRQKVKRYRRSFYSRGTRIKKGIGIVVLVLAVLGAAWLAAPHVLDWATHTWYTVVKNRDLEAESASRAAASSEAAASSAVQEAASSQPEPEQPKELDGKAITGGSWAAVDVSTLADDAAIRAAAQQLKAQGADYGLVTLKTPDGSICYASQVPAAAQSIADTTVDPARIAAIFREEGVIPVAQLAAFKDPISSRTDRSMAIHYGDGLWLDAQKGGNAWLNPYSAAAVEYVGDLVAEVQGMGFEQVVLTNVQFPKLSRKQDYGETSGVSRADQLKADIAALQSRFAGSMTLWFSYTLDQCNTNSVSLDVPAVTLGMDNLLVTADKAMDAIRALVEDSVDAMKVSNADVDLILVGGGSIILPEKIHGAASVLKPEHFGCANAIGSAISKVSGTYEKLMNYDELPREQSLEKAKNEAIELAVEAGAVRETVEIIEMEDVPLAYYPGNTNRVKIKAAGDLN